VKWHIAELIVIAHSQTVSRRFAQLPACRFARPKWTRIDTIRREKQPLVVDTKPSEMLFRSLTYEHERGALWI